MRVKELNKTGLGSRVWGLVKRTGNRFRVSMQLRKLSGQRVCEVPQIVIPNLFRDLGFEKPGLGPSRSEVMLPPAGSEARWREEVMPVKTSREVMPGKSYGEVMLASARKKEILDSIRRKALAVACRRRTCRDARLAKNTPGG